MNVNKNYNTNKKYINDKYCLLLKELIEHRDFSTILYEINGFADEKKWGVTERQNIVCLNENYLYKKIIEFITELDEVDFSVNKEEKIRNINDTKNININENFQSDEIKTNKNKNKTKKYRKTSKRKIIIHNEKKRKRCQNFHKYFNDISFYDPTHLKSYICACGKKCICECNSEYCKGDCDCDFYSCYKKCYLYNNKYCDCLYDSGDC